ncbi:MAG: hypothetical protein ONB37_13170 [candidate division KSB1 bacterium]|nr:hypothetical protein [candidate division KSB1 bacterium]
MLNLGHKKLDVWKKCIEFITNLVLFIQISKLATLEAADIPPVPPSKGGTKESPPLKGDLGGCWIEI